MGMKSDAASQVRIAQEANDIPRQRGGIAGLRQQSCPLVFDEMTHTVGSRAHYRSSRRERLEDRDRVADRGAVRAVSQHRKADDQGRGGPGRTLELAAGPLLRRVREAGARGIRRLESLL